MGISFRHESVMLEEAVASLGCVAGGTYVDGTLGGGGHAVEILKRSAPDGILVGIDADDEAVAASRVRLQEFGRRAIVVKGNFADIREIVRGLGIDSVDGILLDLGVSSHQLDDAERGFSFSRDAPLDMRMDRAGAVTAYDIVNHYPEDELVRILKEYGEEMKARRIVRAIVTARLQAPIRTTGELVRLVADSLPRYRTPSRRHPATKTFQALRIAVNEELSSITRGIEAGIDLLAKGGIISVISFHSLEDRIVKNIFRSWAQGCRCPRHFPVCVCGVERKLKVLTGKPLLPKDEEIERNPRARSAKLRSAVRV